MQSAELGRRRWARVGLVALVALGALGGLAGCGDDGGGNGGGAEPADPPVEGAPEIAVTGENLSFEPGDISVAARDPFNIALTSEDTFHDFTIEGVDGLIDATSGETSRGSYTIDSAGEYTFFCSVPGHREGGMEGTLTVE